LVNIEKYTILSSIGVLFVLFYEAGLKFSCKRCSSCCRKDPGFVYLSEMDVKNLLATLKMDRNSFISTYCRWVTDWKGNEVLSLKEKSNKDCILWNEGCSVYKARPLQCVTFPFWETITTSVKTWEVTASSCPGMNSGKLHTKKAINDFSKLRTSQPVINRIRGE